MLLDKYNSSNPELDYRLNLTRTQINEIINIDSNFIDGLIGYHFSKDSIISDGNMSGEKPIYIPSVIEKIKEYRKSDSNKDIEKDIDITISGLEKYLAKSNKMPALIVSVEHLDSDENQNMIPVEDTQMTDYISRIIFTKNEFLKNFYPDESSFDTNRLSAIESPKYKEIKLLSKDHYNLIDLLQSIDISRSDAENLENLNDILALYFKRDYKGMMSLFSIDIPEDKPKETPLPKNICDYVLGIDNVNNDIRKSITANPERLSEFMERILLSVNDLGKYIFKDKATASVYLSPSQKNGLECFDFDSNGVGNLTKKKHLQLSVLHGYISGDKTKKATKDKFAAMIYDKLGVIIKEPPLPKDICDYVLGIDNVNNDIRKGIKATPERLSEYMDRILLSVNDLGKYIFKNQNSANVNLLHLEKNGSIELFDFDANAINNPTKQKHIQLSVLYDYVSGDKIRKATKDKFSAMIYDRLGVRINGNDPKDRPDETPLVPLKETPVVKNSNGEDLEKILQELGKANEELERTKTELTETKKELAVYVSAESVPEMVLNMELINTLDYWISQITDAHPELKNDIVKLGTWIEPVILQGEDKFYHISDIIEVATNEALIGALREIKSNQA